MSSICTPVYAWAVSGSAELYVWSEKFRAAIAALAACSYDEVESEMENSDTDI